jgi:hypothetical protein
MTQLVSRNENESEVEGCTECGREKGSCGSRMKGEEHCEMPKFIHQQKVSIEELNACCDDAMFLKSKVQAQEKIIRALMNQLGVDHFVDREKGINFHL